MSRLIIKEFKIEDFPNQRWFWYRMEIWSVGDVKIGGLTDVELLLNAMSLIRIKVDIKYLITNESIEGKV